MNTDVMFSNKTDLWATPQDLFDKYDAVHLGCEWFKMSNDGFYSMYGFNFNPHKWGLYEKCRKLVHGDFA